MKSDMRFIFFGTPSFSARTLEALIEHSLTPIAVVCNPDRPIGRKKVLTPPPVKTIAQRYPNIEILQPEKLDEDFVRKLTSLNADFFLVFAYNQIFRKNILAIPRLGTIGVHPSFLPKYRGASPFQTAILNGDSETGVTLYLLDEGIDSGPIIARSAPVKISDEDNFNSLAEKLADASTEILIKMIPDLVAGRITPEPQDKSKASYTKKFTTEDGFIKEEDLKNAESYTREAKEILRKINAFNPEPGAWTMKDGKRMKLLKAKIENQKLVLTKIQIEGEKPRELTN